MSNPTPDVYDNYLRPRPIDLDAKPANLCRWFPACVHVAVSPLTSDPYVMVGSPDEPVVPL